MKTFADLMRNMASVHHDIQRKIDCRNIGYLESCVGKGETSNPVEIKGTVTSVYFSEQTENSNDKSLEDFKTPKPPKKSSLAPKQNTDKPNRKNAKKPVKNRTQSDIRKILTRKQINAYKSEISSKCYEQSCDVDPEHMQLAIALSASLQKSETPCSSTESVTECSKRVTLDQFGFKPKRNVGNVVKKPVPATVRRRRLKPYDLLVKSIQDKNQLSAERYSRVILHNIRLNSLQDSNNTSGRLSELIADHFCPENTLFFKSSMTYFEMENLDVLYVDGLVDKSSAKPGHLLRDWSKIPGRDASPVKVLLSDTIDLTTDNQDELDLLMSGSHVDCRSKLRNQTTKKDENIVKRSGLNTCKYDLCPTQDVGRGMSTSPDLFEGETSPECSFITDTDYPKVVKEENYNDFLPKVTLSQIDVTKDCNTLEAGSGKSFSLDLTKLVDGNDSVHNTHVEIDQNEKSFLNDMIDLTQTDACKVGNFTTSSDECEVTQMFENDKGICHYETFRKSKIEEHQTSKFCDERNNSYALQVEVTLDSSGYKNTETNPDMLKISKNGSANAGEEFTDNAEYFTAKDSVESESNVNGTLQDSTDLLELSASVSSECNDVINISDEELNYSVNKANSSYTSKSNGEKTIDLGVSNSKEGGNFELCGSSIFNQVPSFSDVLECNADVVKPRHTSLERLKLHTSKVSDNVDNLSDESLPVVKVASKRDVDRRFIKCDENSVINVTPKNKNFIVKTDNVTPLLDYASMKSPELHLCLDNYGIRKLKRKRAIQLLEHIYYQTHPVVDYEGEHRQKKRKKLFVVPGSGEGSGICKKMEANDHEENFSTSPKRKKDKESRDVDVYLCSQVGVVVKHLECDPEEWVFQKREKAKVHGCRVPLHIAFHNYVSSRPSLREMILRYEPVSIDLIHKGLAMEGHRYNPKDLLQFLDRKCITVKTEDRSGANRHTRQTSRRAKKKMSKDIFI